VILVSQLFYLLREFALLWFLILGGINQMNDIDKEISAAAWALIGGILAMILMATVIGVSIGYLIWGV
jgi:hypothetical protein